MPNDAETGQSVPDGPADSGGSAREKQLRLLFTFPIFLGLFVCGLNLLTVARLWRSVYFSNPGLLSRANVPNTVCFALLSTSFFLGLCLIACAIAVRHYDELYRGGSEAPSEAPTEAPSYAKFIAIPLLIALPAPALTVWAASVVEPIAPQPCIEILEKALNIQKDNPNFAMTWNDRDQLRCSVNQVLGR